MPKIYTSVARLIIVAGFVALGSVAPALAATEKATTTKATAKTDESLSSSVQSVAQSFATSTALQQGLIVQLDDKNKLAVKPATYKDSKKMFGVVVAANDAPVSLTSGAEKQTAYVVTSGQYKVLVSSQNGAIKSGDFVSISAVNGVAMKADTKQDSVLGRAINGFDGKSNILSSTTLKQSDGKQLKVQISTITVDVNIGPNKQQEVKTDGVPPVIQALATSLIGKPISASQLYVSAAILVTGLGVVASLLYGGIQTGMTAIGRNPLARKSIMRNLIQVIVTGIMIFIGCLIAVYLVLKL